VGCGGRGGEEGVSMRHTRNCLIQSLYNHNNFGNMICNMWNSLQATVITTPSINTFRIRLENFLDYILYSIK